MFCHSILSVNDLLKLGALSGPLTKEEELRTSCLTGADNLNLFNIRGMNGEGLLNSHTIAVLSYCEGGSVASALLLDNSSLKDLDPGLVTLCDPVINLDGITHGKLGNLGLQLFFFKFLDDFCVHYIKPPYVPDNKLFNSEVNSALSGNLTFLTPFICDYSKSNAGDRGPSPKDLSIEKSHEMQDYHIRRKNASLEIFNARINGKPVSLSYETTDIVKSFGSVEMDIYDLSDKGAVTS